MTLYSYTARNAAGKAVRGTVEALSLQAARDSVLSTGLEPEEMYEAPKDAVDVHPDWSSPEDRPVHTSTGIPERAPVEVERTSSSASSRTYLPFADTVRLYAGWLLAWYALAYALGSYQFTRELPFRIPFVEGLFLSPLVLSFSCAAFLYLLLANVHDRIGGKTAGWTLGVLGLLVYVLFIRNV